MALDPSIVGVVAAVFGASDAAGGGRLGVVHAESRPATYLGAGGGVGAVVAGAQALADAGTDSTVAAAAQAVFGQGVMRRTC